ncbi:MAG: DUF4258 domain-containing protein [Alphaproteobacteria bacterium]
MPSLLARIQKLVNAGEVRISVHGYRELAADDILASEVINGVGSARIIEEYPASEKGPCLLVLQLDGKKRIVHAVWGIAKGTNGPAVLVTAYRPDPKLWSADFMTRRKQ